MRTTTREPLSSSDARYAILSRHDELRGLVNETIRYADVVTNSVTNSATNSARNSDCDFEPLRAHARELYRAFQTHMDFEERILGTALRDVIGWGAVLHAQIEEGHERQRATLASAMSALEPQALSSTSLVESVRTVADSLLHDLTDEEKCLLNADLDAIAVDSRGG